MKKFLLSLAIVTLSSAAQAATVFSDNFNANTTALNAVPSGWTVSGGTVDLIGNGFFDFIPGSGVFVDLDGTTSNAGVLSTSLSLTAGTQYTASFDLAGNHRNTSPETVTGILGVGIGNVSNTFSLSQNIGWTTFSLVFTPVVSGTYVLSFANSGGDNIGMLLDNVTVTAVPEPESYAMLLAGLGLMGFVARRRKRK